MNQLSVFNTILSPVGLHRQIVTYRSVNESVLKRGLLFERPENLSGDLENSFRRLANDLQRVRKINANERDFNVIRAHVTNDFEKCFGGSLAE